MRAKRLLSVLLVMLMIAALAGCGNSSPAVANTSANNAETQSGETSVEMEPVNWSMGTHQGAANSYFAQDCNFADRVRERTNGLVNITVYAAGELPYAATEFAQLVSDGTIEMAIVPSSYISGECPTTSVSAWPMLAGAVDEINTALEASQPYVEKELSEKNISVLGSQPYPMQTMFGCGNAPHSLADLKGLKMRVFDPYQADILAEIGVTPVSMVMNEVLSSMQKNVIDSALTGVIGAYEAKWYDVIDWAYLMPVAASNCYMIINQSLLEGLPEEIQQIILEEAEAYTQECLDYNVREIPNAAKNLEEKGVEVVYPSDEDIAALEKIAVEYWEKWAGDYDENTVACYNAIKEALNK